METMQATEKRPTLEDVWAILNENARQMKVNEEKTNREMRKLSKIVGGLGNSIGELIETLIAARLWEKFSDFPYQFKRAYRRVQVFDDATNKELTDIDIMLTDTEWVMAVEVKRDLVLKDVERHIKRMKLISEHPPAEAKNKKLLGAMAGGTIDPDAFNAAYETGFFVLELKGESVELLAPPKGFKPKEWGL